MKIGHSTIKDIFTIHTDNVIHCFICKNEKLILTPSLIDKYCKKCGFYYYIDIKRKLKIYLQKENNVFWFFSKPERFIYSKVKNRYYFDYSFLPSFIKHYKDNNIQHFLNKVNLLK